MMTSTHLLHTVREARAELEVVLAHIPLAP